MKVCILDLGIVINMKTALNCEYCGSKIFETDRSCVKCGAPISMAEVKRDTFGEFMRDVERGEPASFVREELVILFI